MKSKRTYVGLTLLSLVGCMKSPEPVRPVVPSLDYANSLRAQSGLPLVGIPAGDSNGSTKVGLPLYDSHTRARVRLVTDDATAPDGAANIVTNNEASAVDGRSLGDDVYVRRSSMPNTRDYSGPLSLGDPGVSASLWQESKRASDIFRDDRAFHPMDLITIVVSETAEGSKEADTETKGKSSLTAAISSLFGLEKQAKTANASLDPTSLVNASSQNDFKGEGTTTRKGSLKAKISAMVVEVLASGVLRVEGEKIISVNNEEQVMILSGLVRQRDITSENEVDSSKIANMRIDYYGKGIVGEAQYGGWAARALRVLWPF